LTHVNKFTLVLAAASFGLLAACGGKGDDTAGDKVAADADAAADSMENQADAMSNAGNQAAADSMNAQADATREAGERAEDAIDNADIQTSNPAATAKAVEEKAGLPTSTETATEAAKAK
jgi:hypothetical protein